MNPCITGPFFNRLMPFIDETTVRGIGLHPPDP